MDIYDTFCKTLDDGKEVRSALCDFSKAFDKVWYIVLLFKLNSVGINCTLLQWFTDYLKDRKKHAVLPGVSSDWCFIIASVPQGSILGPLLFLVFTNDIVEEINSSIRLFADDTSLYIVVDDLFDSAIKLNADLSRLDMLALMWLIRGTFFYVRREVDLMKTNAYTMYIFGKIELLSIHAT